jgi:hypothetical protein
MRPVESLRSGAHTDGPSLYTVVPYPQHWQQPSDVPVTRSVHDEAMAAAASLLVVPEK